MAATVDREVIEALARHVVAEVSPAELVLFPATARRYFADPESALAGSRSTDQTLGFGAEAAVVLIGPFALDLAKKVLTRLLDKLGEAAADGLAARLARRLRPERDEPASADPLDGAQLTVVRQTAGEEARRLALPPDQANRLADALVAALATRG